MAVYDEAIKYIVAGGNAMRLRAGLEKALVVALDALKEQVQPLTGSQDLTHFAHSICPDDTITDLLGEIFGIIGSEGLLEVRLGRSKTTECDYVEGHLWEGGLLTRNLILEPLRQRSDQQEAAILVSDLEIETASQLSPALRLALQGGEKNLLLLARKLSEEAVALLIKVNRDSAQLRVTAVKTPGTGLLDQAAALEDLCALTGGRPFMQAAGQTLERIRLEDFGHARRLWADMERFVIVNGKGDPGALRQHIAGLRRGIARAETPEQGHQLRERIGRLLGGAAILSVGGATETEMKTRRAVAERSALILRSALQEGTVQGGGIALLDCRAALHGFSTQAGDEEERMAGRVLAKALEAPARAILRNSGLDPSSLIPYLGAGSGIDVRTGRIVNMRSAGIMDSAASIGAALASAVRSAALALTVDVVIHKRNPQASVNP
jgi:chaperonin GroEL